MISFSVIVSCIVISLLLVIVGILYNRAGCSINVAISILFDSENISFDASLVMCVCVCVCVYIYRVSQEEWTKLRESVP